MREVVKGDVGDKTCFDALIPAVRAMGGKQDVAELFWGGCFGGRGRREKHRAAEGKIGRARNLGEKSVGTLDPGAVSCAMIFAALRARFKIN